MTEILTGAAVVALIGLAAAGIWALIDRASSPH